MRVEPINPGIYEATQWHKGDPVPKHGGGAIYPRNDSSIWRFVCDTHAETIRSGDWIVTSPDGYSSVIREDKFREQYREVLVTKSIQQAIDDGDDLKLLPPLDLLG